MTINQSIIPSSIKSSICKVPLKHGSQMCLLCINSRHKARFKQLSTIFSVIDP